ncbi:MAG TPA: adenylate kinase [Candidatus Binatia bacterium]|jgi:adenylate kinase|nr:adenylate kinase [Candidatus Binatia bacterium]
MYNILMLGAQGSGKGTQSERLSAKLGIPTISVGHLFRDEIEKKTGLGRTIVSYIERGDRVPSEIVNQLMLGRLDEEDTMNGVILDGYPRTFDQKDELDRIFAEHGRQLTHVIYLNVPDEVSLQRLSGRWICSKCEANYHATLNPPKGEPGKCDKDGAPLIQRDDDKPDAIRHRLDLYHKDTQPLIDHYRQRGILYEIDGTQPIPQVESSLNAALGI